MMDYRTFSDGQLLDMLRHHDERAFSELYNRYWEKLFNAGYKRLGNVEGTEEVVQDLFTDLWLRRQSLQIRQELPVYLFSAVKYLVIKQIHKAAKTSLVHEFPPALQNEDNSTEEWVIAHDLQSHLQNRVELLPVKCREIYQLSRNAHQSNKAIARQLQISEKTVENQITKALKHLRASLTSLLF